MNSTPLNSEAYLCIEDLSKRFDQFQAVHQTDLEIKKGELFCLLGPSGCGKTTLLRMLAGFEEPSEGKIFLDGNELNSIPPFRRPVNMMFQSYAIFPHMTVEENIAFGVAKENISFQQVKKAAKQAKIAELIESWDDGYQTFVGEQGIRLSGGQRQRIGIARALYKRADVLIFDEATNALDSATEREVMNSIEDLEKEITILIIAHRLTTLKKCNQIVKLDKNKISNITYEEITE